MILSRRIKENFKKLLIFVLDLKDWEVVTLELRRKKPNQMGWNDNKGSGTNKDKLTIKN